MATAKTPIRLEAERLCQQMPEAPTKTLARRLADEFSCTLEQARTTVRRVRGASGTKERKYATTQRKGDPEAAKRAKVPPTQLPESLAEPWEPITLEGSKVLVLSDVHIPYHDKRAVEAAIKFGQSVKPDVVLINGDFADFYSQSRHQKDPRKRNVKGEIAAIQQGLRHFREQFDCQIIYKFGNHEERWDVWVWNHAPEIADLEEIQLSQILRLQEIGVEWVDQQRPIMAGKLPIFHGHELPKGMSSPVNQARGAFLRMLDTVLVGHGHRSSSHTEPSWEHNETTCWSTGCLCDMSPEYARINKWNWGFAYVEIDSDGSFAVHNKRISKSHHVRPA